MLVLGLALLAGTIHVVSRRLNEEAAVRLQKRLAFIEERTGIRMRGDGFQTGFGSLRIKSLKVILPKGNPGKSNSGNPVEILRQIEPSLKSLVGELRVTGDAPGQTWIKSAVNWILPKRVVLDIGHIEIIAANENRSEWLVHATDFHVRMDRRTPRLNFHARELHVTGLVPETNVSGHLRLWPRSGDIELAASQAPDAQFNGWGFRARTGLDARKIHLELNATHMPPSISTLAAKYLGTNLIPSRDTSFETSLDIMRLGEEMIEFAASLNFRDLFVQDKGIAIHETGPLHLDATMSGKFDPGSSALIVDHARIEVPAPIEFEPAHRAMAQRSSYDFEVSGSVEPAVIVNFTASGPLRLPDTINRLLLRYFPPKSRRTPPASWKVRAFIARTPCQGLLDVLPPRVVPALKGFELGGDFMGIASITWPHGRPGEFRMELTNDEFSCAVTEEPAGYAAANFSGPIKARVGSRGMDKRDLDLSPSNPRFTPYARISGDFIKTVVAAEDTSFWSHGGVARNSFVDAVRDNLNEGRMARGGSTIAMQMVKNLMLGNERTMSRKIQEVFLAWHLGKSLDHRRILEVYANMIELGPDIFGVGEAADFYFGKKPSELNLKESLFLVNLMPSPVERAAAFCRRHEPTGNFTRLMDDLLDRMRSLDIISAAELASARSTKILFRTDEVADRKVCNPAKEST